MNSALLWLPAAEYDSLKSLWLDGYVWSALPVDSSILPHQTSFITLDNGDTVIARSASKDSGASLHVTPNHADQPATYAVGDAAADHKLSADGSDAADDPASAAGTSACHPSAPRPTRKELVIKALSSRPSLTGSARLRSFHLGRDRLGDVQPPAATRQWQQESYKATMEHLLPALEKAEAVVLRAGPQETGAATQALDPKPTRQPKPATGVDVPDSVAYRGLKGDALLETLSKRSILAPESPRKSSKVISRQSPSSKRACLKLNLNLEVEVQLRMTLKGDITLSLLS